MPPNLDYLSPDSSRWNSPRFDEILNALPGIAYVVDNEMRVQAVNHAWDEAARQYVADSILGAHIIGKSLLDAVSDEALRAFYEQVMRNILRGEVKDFSQVIDTNSSPEGQQHFHLEIRPLRGQGGIRGLLFHAVDCTKEYRTRLELMEKERKLANLQENIEQYQREDVLFERLWKILASHEEAENTSQQILTDLVASLEIEYGVFYTLQDGCFRLEASCGITTEQISVCRELNDTDVEHSTQAVVSRFPFEGQAGPVIEFVKTLGAQIFIAIPTMCQGEKRGLLVLASVNQEKFQDSDLGFIKLTGSVLAGKYILQSTIEALDAATNYHELLTRDSEQFWLHHTKPEALHKLILQRFSEESSAMFATFNLFDESQQKFLLASHWNAPEFFKNVVGTDIGSMQIGEPPSGLSALERRPLYFENVPENENYIPWNQLAQDNGFGSIWSFPLIAGEEVLAVVNLYFSDITHPMSQELLNHFEALAERAAMVVHCAHAESHVCSQKEETSRQPLEGFPLNGISIGFRGPEGDVDFECSLKPTSEENAENRKWTLNVERTPTVEQETEDTKPELRSESDSFDILEKMASTIGKDFNNLLTGIMGRASLLAEELDSNHPSQTDIVSLIEATQKASALIRNLLNFGDKQEPLFQPLNFSDIFQSLEVSLPERKPEAVELNFHHDVAESQVPGDASQILRLLDLLANNAFAALPEGGRIEVSAEKVHVEEPPADAWLSAASGDYVRLRVQDNGMGISPEQRSHLFEPFFTGWKQGSHTGLGLTSVWAITQKHGGWIHLSSSEGEGATFDIYLPIQSSEVALDKKDDSAVYYPE
ncbi:GAF domain-containing protein [bacterium]|nr:GAF domain-containing protein [bacterium]